jgi:hypothetical protein
MELESYLIGIIWSSSRDRQCLKLGSARTADDGEWRIGNGYDKSCRGVIEVLPSHLPEEPENTTENLNQDRVRINLLGKQHTVQTKQNVKI